MAREDQEPRVRPISVRADRPRRRPWVPLVAGAAVAVFAVVGILASIDLDGDESVEPTRTAAPNVVDEPTAPPRTTTSTMPIVVGESVPGLELGDGSTVFDLALEDGSRVGVWLPATMGDTLTREDAATESALGVFTAPAFALSLTAGFCDGEVQDRAELSLRGTPVNRTDPQQVIACRPDQFLVMTIQSTVPLTTSDSQQLHLVPLGYGQDYAAWIIGALYAGPQCCQEELGPLWHDDTVFVANGHLDGQVTALDGETLAPLWNRTVGDESFLHGIAEYGDEVVVVASPQVGSVKGLAVGSGAELWSLNLGEGFVAGVSAGDDGVWYVAYAYRTEGDVRAPRLRAVNVVTGDILWDADGFVGTDWQWVEPKVLGDIVVMVDVPYAGGGAATASVIAFDVETGATRWTLPLESSTEAYAQGHIVTDPSHEPPLLLVATIDGKLVRIDPVTGAEVWRAATGFGNIIGVGPDVATFRSRFGEFDIDLIDGALR